MESLRNTANLKKFEFLRQFSKALRKLVVCSSGFYFSVGDDTILFMFDICLLTVWISMSLSKFKALPFLGHLQNLLSTPALYFRGNV